MEIEPEVTEYDLMIEALLDGIHTGVPQEALKDLCVDAQNTLEFHAGMSAAAELSEIVRSHYDNQKEPENG